MGDKICKSEGVASATVAGIEIISVSVDPRSTYGEITLTLIGWEKEGIKKEGLYSLFIEASAVHILSDNK